ncbi:cobalt-precorrin-5B (C(1))-methyltransferase [Roseococcus suduntuyensis]|uniref:Cobalt-precorrin-5B C(1)-methyltransferase n=1 Tax=Roseococcus suduntuyensis TaxID=455361 RepID=A0A840AGR6_9PROT|nr:cobalt-precorrin-5B (C(1))-methyltransferase [Roseococcus suduntuyensis]MBB3899753.1 cobalt-precorrin-5B (C1)-methyltransferase [Roseococcus suduntuyensis]
MDEGKTLRRGWTTGACATAAAKAAYAALVHGDFPDPVTIRLPGGETPAFALARAELMEGGALAAIVKDAGDDPDVTHGALILVTVRPLARGAGLRFRAGPGVGTITRPGLPLPPGEPAINPGPRAMIRAALEEVSPAPDAEVEISIADGERLAERTLNGRLGILGGLSVLGTTGIVIPYSCAAWIDSIHRGVDVARAMGIAHVAGSTGSASEAAVRKLHGLPDVALIEMGDFVGGMLKYLRRHPVARVTVAGGVAKMTKLAQRRLDLHSKRGEADLGALGALLPDVALAARIAAANTVAEAFQIAEAAGQPLGDAIAARAWAVAAEALVPAPTELEIVVFDRTGRLVGRADFAAVGHSPSLPLKRR